MSTPATPPASTPLPAQPAKKQRSRYYRMLPNARYAIAFNVVCALVITYLLNPGSSLGQNLVASMCIGTIAFGLIDGARLTIWGEKQRPKTLPLLAIILVSVPVAQWLGLHLFTWLTDAKVKALTTFDTAEVVANLVFTLVVTGMAVLFFASREKMSRLQAVAANEKARAEQEARQAMQAQLQLLQAQIEPHMLFNTLANLQGLISFDPERAQLLLDNLIQYLRATLSSSRAQSTTLGQEFALMEAYLGLMAIRMGARLRYTLALPPELQQASLPPMLLQPLVENAIQHGLEPKIEGGHIAVTASNDNGQLTIIVHDDGLGLDHPSQSKGTHLGVSNIRERLQAMFGAQASLALDANPDAGVTARLSLPASAPPMPVLP